MSEYTAEDFKNARFASHYAGGTSRRALHGMWDSGPSGRRRTDGEMAADGWRPVHEHNPRETDALEEEIQDLRDELHERELAEASAPDTLDTLREAWENAEQSEDCRVGDTLIDKISDADEYVVWASARGIKLERARILHRAPQPGQWEELMRVLSEVVGEPVEPWQALWAYGMGVRVTGGDET